MVERPEDSAGWIILGPELHFAGNGFPRHGLDEREGKINPSRDASRRPDRTIPHDPLLSLGFLLVMVVPCSSMAIGYTGLSKGNLELANAIVFSSYTGKEVSLPLDRQIFDRLLRRLVRTSRGKSPKGKK